jgi:hypothetical protein
MRPPWSKKLTQRETRIIARHHIFPADFINERKEEEEKESSKI